MTTNLRNKTGWSISIAKSEDVEREAIELKILSVIFVIFISMTMTHLRTSTLKNFIFTFTVIHIADIK
jgi:hypothetical protein